MPGLDLASAAEVFVRGHAAERSRVFPYVVDRAGATWVMRDAPGRPLRDRRVEEWVDWQGPPDRVDAAIRSRASGRFALSYLVRADSDIAPARTGFRDLGWRLLRTEGVFVHDLESLPRAEAPVRIEPVVTATLAAQLAAATRTRPLAGPDFGFPARRQYVALDGDRIVGRVRSLVSAKATWCADMHVDAACRRRGIGRALLARMLHDDRAAGSAASVLTATRTGALLYPTVGYRRIATLLVLVPRPPPA